MILRPSSSRVAVIVAVVLATGSTLTACSGSSSDTAAADPITASTEATSSTIDQAVEDAAVTTTTAAKRSTTTTVKRSTTTTTPAKSPTVTGCGASYVFPDLSSAPGAGGSYAKPSVTASCGNGLLTVKSNGMIAYNFVSRTPNGLRAQSYTWTVTTSPQVAASSTSIAGKLGTVAFTVTGIPIFGPMEGPVPPQEAFGDPVYNNLLDTCKGHTGYNADYHYHAIIADAACYLNETIIGYSLDGFPIYSNPGYKYKSGYTMTGNPRSNAWSAYTYAAGGANTLDACNGRTDADGSYRYYVTEAFPYIIGCYTGTARAQVGAAAAPMPAMNRSVSAASTLFNSAWLCDVESTL